jgi:hypothetical protein
VDSLASEAKVVGCLFRRADALNNPWRARRPEVRMSPVLRASVEPVIQRLAELDLRHQEIIKGCGLGAGLPDDLGDFVSLATEVVRRMRPLAEAIPSPEAQLVRLWLKEIRGKAKEDLDRLYRRCGEAVALAERVKATSLDPTWTKLCEGLNPLELESLFVSARIVLGQRGRRWRLLSPAYRRARRAVEALCPGMVSDAFWTMAKSLLAHLEAYSARERLAQVNTRLVPGGAFPHRVERDQVRFPREAREALEKADWLSREGRTRPWLDKLLDASLASVGPQGQKAVLDEVEVGLQRTPILLGMRKSFDELGKFFLPESLKTSRRSFEGGESIGDWIREVQAGLERLPDLIALETGRQGRAGLAQAVLKVLEDYERDLQAGEPVPEPPTDFPESEHGRWWAALVKHSAAVAWQCACERDYPELAAITPEIHAIRVEKLRDLLQCKRSFEAEVIKARWVARQISHRNAPWAMICAIRSGKKNGGAKSLREAVELGLEHGLLAMRPCWLANPSSVSQIFPLTAGLFDLVIFDEASQCPVEQALPAIHRGTSLIVSGDEKQLPPTDFFSVRLQNLSGDGNGDEEDAEATDEAVTPESRLTQQVGQNFMIEVEDLLEAAVALFPHEAQAELRVHYRSRHPALIEFSNRAFYGRRLEAPPSANAAWGNAPPIEYCRVDGTYRERVNRDEAREVVRLLEGYWCAEGSCQTIGVVTFNKPQQELIEDLIEERCEENDQFRVRYREERTRREGEQDVGFFVRNLENVQGDERGVMIFSTTFGRNPEGKFYRRFGPVGQVGGERRLNVAVTRAKYRVIVVGSMPIGEVSSALGPGMGPGAQLNPSGYLQLYLAYAKAVSDGDWDGAAVVLGRMTSAPVETRRGPESPLEEEVLEELKKWGPRVDCQVGESGFRIDLAVWHRDPMRGYALGIECDGATYHSDLSARARDVWREDILRDRGWEIHRIWSTRWWSSKDQEIARLKAEVDRVLSS